jgi:hypothetical protein
MEMSENIDKIAPALVEIQDSMIAIKDADNPFYKSKYAPLDEILKSIRPNLKENGITIIQTIANAEKFMICTTRIMHKTGQWIDSEFTLPAEKSTPQGYGSAATYLRRYGICAALSISTPNEDDDANKAEEQAEKNKKAAAEAAKLVKYNEKLQHHKDGWREGLTKLDFEAVKEAFEAGGFVSDNTDKIEAIDDLLSQVDNLTKLKNAKELAKKRHDAMREAKNPEAKK